MRLHTEPETAWKNIFQLWKENGESLPFKVAKSTWSSAAGHYLIVEKVEVKSGRMAMLGATITGTGNRLSAGRLRPQGHIIGSC